MTGGRQRLLTQAAIWMQDHCISALSVVHPLPDPHPSTKTFLINSSLNLSCLLNHNFNFTLLARIALF